MARVEKRLTVEQHEDGSAFYDPYVFSRPKHPLARFRGPFARGLQRRFARDSLRATLLATPQKPQNGEPGARNSKAETCLLDCGPD